MVNAFAPSDDSLPAPRGRGRPGSYTPEMGERICEAVKVSQGGLRSVLDQDASLPSYGLVVDWITRYPDFSANLARARVDRFKLWAEDLSDIAMDETLDPASRRVILDTKKWLLSKELHRVYGDKLDLTSGGETIATPSHQIDARVQSIIMQAQARGAATADSDALSAEALRLLE